MNIIIIISIVLILLFTFIILMNEINKYKILFKNERVTRTHWEKKYEDLQKKYEVLNQKYTSIVINNDESILDIMRNSKTHRN